MQAHSATRPFALPCSAMRRALTVVVGLILLTACSGGDSGPGAVGESVAAEANVTAAEVTAAIEASGLPVLNPRDNSANCDSLPCVEQLTTDLFSVTVWDTPGDAQHAVDVALSDKPIRAGTVTTISFHEGGTTPDYDRAAYEQAVADLP